MADLVVIVPSRGRPQAARDFIDAFGATRTSAYLVFVIDEDDPQRDEYQAVVGSSSFTHDLGGSPATMVTALNFAAVKRAMADDPPFAIGFMGDDHRPRTVGWDERYLDALRDIGTGIVYGNDLLQGYRLPTQCAMTSDIVRALGYMAPPALKHLYVDNAWQVWGNSIHRLRYLKDVIVEHRHPLAGKAAWDEGYERVNSSAVAEHDRVAFEDYVRDGLEADLVKLRALLSVTA